MNTYYNTILLKTIDDIKDSLYSLGYVWNGKDINGKEVSCLDFLDATQVLEVDTNIGKKTIFVSSPDNFQLYVTEKDNINGLGKVQHSALQKTMLKRYGKKYANMLADWANAHIDEFRKDYEKQLRPLERNLKITKAEISAREKSVQDVYSSKVVPALLLADEHLPTEEMSWPTDSWNTLPNKPKKAKSSKELATPIFTLTDIDAMLKKLGIDYAKFGTPTGTFDINNFLHKKPNSIILKDGKKIFIKLDNYTFAISRDNIYHKDAKWTNYDSKWQHLMISNHSLVYSTALRDWANQIANQFCHTKPNSSKRVKTIESAINLLQDDFNKNTFRYNVALELARPYLAISNSIEFKTEPNDLGL